MPLRVLFIRIRNDCAGLHEDSSFIQEWVNFIKKMTLYVTRYHEYETLENPLFIDFPSCETFWTWLIWHPLLGVKNECHNCCKYTISHGIILQLQKDVITFNK